MIPTPIATQIREEKTADRPTVDAFAEGWVAAFIKGLLDGLDEAGPVIRAKLDAILREQDIEIKHAIDYAGSATVSGPMGRPHEIPIKVHLDGVHRLSASLQPKQQ